MGSSRPAASVGRRPNRSYTVSIYSSHMPLQCFALPTRHRSIARTLVRYIMCVHTLRSCILEICWDINCIVQAVATFAMTVSLTLESTHPGGW